MTSQKLKKLSYKTLIIFLILSFFSCGFQVIYHEKIAENDLNYVAELAAIRIKKTRTRNDQELKNNLYDLLNPDYVKTEPKYFLTLTINESISATFISSTGASGRNKITLSVSYELKNLATAAIISNGTTAVNDNYDVGSNRYATYVAENYVRSNLTKVAAQNIRNSLVNDLIETTKKCTEEIKKDKEFVCPLTAKSGE
jgi:hypothetical protein